MRRKPVRQSARMPSTERPRRKRGPQPTEPVTGSEPIHSTALPRELRQFLRDHEFACVTESTDQGTVLILKAPSADIESARGTVPIEMRHELCDSLTPPVIRMVTTLYDQPQRP